MTPINRTAVAVTFLTHDEVARRMVLSWSLVSLRAKGRELIAEWSTISGVPYANVERLADVLFKHGICRPDRTVDPEAERVITHVAAAMLRNVGKTK